MAHHSFGVFMVQGTFMPSKCKPFSLEGHLEKPVGVLEFDIEILK